MDSGWDCGDFSVVNACGGPVIKESRSGEEERYHQEARCSGCRWRACGHQQRVGSGTEGIARNRRRLRRENHCRTAISCKESARPEEDYSRCNLREGQRTDHRQAEHGQEVSGTGILACALLTEENHTGRNAGATLARKSKCAKVQVNMAARSVNKVILVGNLGKDAETKFTPGGIAVTKFSIATGRRWK